MVSWLDPLCPACKAKRVTDDPKDTRTPAATTASALHRLNLQHGAKARMREIAAELARIHIIDATASDGSAERHVRVLGEELARLIDTL